MLHNIYDLKQKRRSQRHLGKLYFLSTSLSIRVMAIATLHILDTVVPFSSLLDDFWCNFKHLLVYNYSIKCYLPINLFFVLFSACFLNSSQLWHFWLCFPIWFRVVSVLPMPLLLQYIFSLSCSPGISFQFFLIMSI